MDFTLKQYSKLLDALGNGDYGLINNKNIIRHDVDRSIPNAVKIAEIEFQKRIKTTYFFRVPKTFDMKAIDKIHSFGHEVGYHYEVLDKAKGNYSKAIDLFEKEWKLFERWGSKSICMHGNPLSKYDNRNLWKKYDFRRFGVEKEAYLSFDFNKIVYFTDTGRAWNNKFVSVKDKTDSDLIRVNNTDHLIELIKNKKVSKFYILTHPCRWNDNLVSWCKELVWQNVKNIGKRLF